ncbi:MAG: class I SAM-dependent methyltransferase [Woeseiaceae bacterium]
MKKLDKVSSYWKDVLGNEVSLAPGERIFFPAFADLARASDKILEIGVGRGRMVQLLKDSGVQSEFHGVDITDNAMASGTIGKIGDTRSLSYPDDSFDLVYSLGVVEHFPETDVAVKEHVRVTKKGGHVLITTPHASIFTPLRYGLYLAKERSMGSFEEIRGRNIRLSTMKRNFLKTGEVEIVEAGTCGLMGMRAIMRAFKLSDVPSWMEKLERNPAIGAYLYVVAKKL